MGNVIGMENAVTHSPKCGCVVRVIYLSILRREWHKKESIMHGVGGIWKVRNNVTMFWGIGHELWNGILTTMFSISLLTIMTVVKNTTQNQIHGLGIYNYILMCVSVLLLLFFIIFILISKVDYFDHQKQING